jgi:hypothetical protein
VAVAMYGPPVPACRSILSVQIVALLVVVLGQDAQRFTMHSFTKRYKVSCTTVTTETDAATA